MFSRNPVGMVERLGSDGFGPGEDELAFALAYMADGDMDPAVVARLRDPDRGEERERVARWRRDRDWAAVSQYRDANRALDGQTTDVVFMGDSITEMWGVAQPDLFSNGVVNRGISGQTSPQMLVRFMPDVIGLRPRVVHLMCGVNDIAGNTGPTTPQDYRNTVLAMVSLAQANGVAVILGGVTPITGLPWAPGVDNPRGRVAALNAWLTDLASERGLVHAAYFNVLADADGALRADLTRDGVHPGSRGYAAMRPVVDAAIAKALAGPA